MTDLNILREQSHQTTGGALGGNRFYTTTAELQFPTGLPKEFGLRGALFSDVGSLWSLDRPGPLAPRHQSWRRSALSWVFSLSCLPGSDRERPEDQAAF